MFCGVWSTWTVCLCYHSSLWVIFSAPKSLCVLIPRSSLPTKSRQPLIFVPSPEFCLPECHIVGINHCADFSDCLLLLAICIYIFVSFHALIAHFFFFFFLSVVEYYSAVWIQQCMTRLLLLLLLLFPFAMQHWMWMLTGKPDWFFFLWPIQ